ncbi:TPA: hypothetical protein ACMVZ1_002234, partial [Enterococcus faecium]
NFCEFQLISEGVASASAVYTCLERGTKVFFTFVPRSLFSEKSKYCSFYKKEIIIKETSN